MLRYSGIALLLFCSAGSSFAQWVSIGPDGGSAHVLAIDPQNPKHLLAGSRGLLLYQSEDAGDSWHPVGDLASSQSLYQAALNVVAIDPGDSQTFYAGVSATNGRAAEVNGAGIYKTADGGKNWTRIPSLAGISVYCLAIWGKDRHLMVAGTNHGVYRTRDSAETWERISPAENYELQGVMSIAMDSNKPGVIYAGTPHLPWKTADGGATWNSIHTGMIDDSDVFSIRIDERNSQRVYASACSGIYGSTSGGSSWSKLQGIPSTNRRTHVIAQDPKHGSILYAATTLGLWKSTSSGASWRKTMEDSINALVLDPDGTMYLAVDQRGLLKSEDGGETFHEINHGYINRTITTMQTAGGPSRPLLYVSTIYDGRWGGLMRTEDGTGKWDLLASEQVLHGRNLTSFAALGESGRLVAASYDGFLRSSDDGHSWTEIVSGKAIEIAPAKKGRVTPGKPTRAQVVHTATTRPGTRGAATSAESLVFPSNKIHINAFRASTGTEPFLIAATSAGLFRSTTGDEWQNLRILPKINLPVSAVFVSPGDTGGVAAITPAGLFVSHDRGAAWLSTAIPYKPDAIYEVSFDFKDPNLVLAATSVGIYQSFDGGKTWEFHYGGMPKGEVTSVIFHPLRHAEAYALHYGYIYRSTDGGAHWRPFDRAGLGNVTFRTIAFDVSQAGPRLYGLTVSRGIFAYKVASAGDTEIVTGHPHTTGN